ncbi:acylphosphatase, partial [bacterium]|nr:acylphosphatase [bacterium]
VQGVFFRRFVQRHAQRNGLCGLARNEPDGSLTVILEGEKEKIFALLPVILEGPPAGEVKEVELKITSPQNLEGFQIL